MRSTSTRVMLCSLLALFCIENLRNRSVEAQEATTTSNQAMIPEVLEPWKGWVTWNTEHLNCPSLFSKSDERICYWPSRMSIEAGPQGGKFTGSFRAFEPTWVMLPGSNEAWPFEVTVDGAETPVITRDGHPAVRLTEGNHKVTGRFRWRLMPQRIVVPEQIGLLSLSVDQTKIPIPTWDSKGNVWLKRTQATPETQDSIDAKVYRLIEDGIPLWLETQIELTVSGKSREETLGWVLPEGWELSTVTSPIPVAIDDRGEMKAQVRAGKWTVVLRAFRTTDPDQIAFSADAKPVASEELVGLKTNTQFRIAQLDGIAIVDVTQTQYPKQWRDYSVHRWDTSQSFRLVEKMRGRGQPNPPGLDMNRQFWLDEDGTRMTYRDTFSGTMQRTWRLDISDDAELGAVRVDGQAQLITENPTTGASGVEIRRRNLDLTAIGRIDRSAKLAATGWQTDVDQLRMTFMLPPGWRTFAIFGADEVYGDWLTAWSLLDVFLLLIFSFAVFRMYGITAGVIALLAFGLSYHELGAPRLTWICLLMPLALLRVVSGGAIQTCLQVWKYLAIATLLFSLIPFVASQVQSVIYPQLERTGYAYGQRGILSLPSDVNAYPSGRHDSKITPSRKQDQAQTRSNLSLNNPVGKILDDRAFNAAKQLQGRPQESQQATSNLKYAASSRIQTGPAEPRWQWNEVSCIWNGPVKASQQIQPIFISLTQHRLLTLGRITLLLILTLILLKTRSPKSNSPKSKLPKASVGGAPLLLCFLSPMTALAQFPDPQLLQDLKRRLIEQPERISDAAEIPTMKLTLNDNTIQMEATIHAAAKVAVPLPGRLPTWSPISVSLDGEAVAETIRRDNYLWVLIPEGIHKVTVKGLLPESADWTWTFLLAPKTVDVSAENWKVTGIDSNGIPDAQIFFVKEQEATGDQAAYDRSNFKAIVRVDRYLEIGLVSKVRTVVTRLSSPGKAVSLSIPLLEGESVITSQSNVQGSAISIQLSASQQEIAWRSELPSLDRIQLTAADTDQWVERWHLVTSPIWNVTLEGIQPIYEDSEQDLIPVWHPWPGESVVIALSKPVAIQGNIVTVQNVDFDTQLGSRLRDCTLVIDFECSIANDFVVQLDKDSENVALEIDGQSVPVQQVDARLTIPAQPGRHLATVRWRTAKPLTLFTQSGEVILPVEASNITTTIQVPENRWLLWANGPMRGPAVRFWTVLCIAILAAFALGGLRLSPLKRYEWVLLAIGLTQVPLTAAAIVVGWLFLLAWRGSPSHRNLGTAAFDLVQVVIIFSTIAALGVLVFVVSIGLLGNPDMFISGNGSARTFLRWFQPRINQTLPTTSMVSVSVWCYRLLMLFWALWLAVAVLRWLTWGWKQFSDGGAWKTKTRPIEATLVHPTQPEGVPTPPQSVQPPQEIDHNPPGPAAPG